MTPEDQSELLISIKTTLDRMDHELFGNGQPGKLRELDTKIQLLDDRVESHERFKSYIKGTFAAISTIVSALGVTEFYHLFLGKGK